MAEANGAVAGLAQVGPPRDDDVDVDYELYMIYLLEEHHASGAARDMLADLLTDSSAYLWVLKKQPSEPRPSIANTDSNPTARKSTSGAAAPAQRWPASWRSA